MRVPRDFPKPSTGSRLRDGKALDGDLSGATEFDEYLRELYYSSIFTGYTGIDFIHDIIDRMRLFEYEEDALTQLATCEKKAFVGSVEEITDFHKFNQNSAGLARGKEAFLSHNLVWKIPLKAGGFVHRRMSQLISSGIYHFWGATFHAKTRDELDLYIKKNNSNETVIGH